MAIGDSVVRRKELGSRIGECENDTLQRFQRCRVDFGRCENREKHFSIIPWRWRDGKERFPWEVHAGSTSYEIIQKPPVGHGHYNGSIPTWNLVVQRVGEERRFGSVWHSEFDISFIVRTHNEQPTRKAERS
jgi:hypothetical protein